MCQKPKIEEYMEIFRRDDVWISWLRSCPPTRAFSECQLRLVIRIFYRVGEKEIVLHIPPGLDWFETIEFLGFKSFPPILFFVGLWQVLKHKLKG